MDDSIFVFHGTVIHSANLKTLETHENALLAIKADGTIHTLKPDISPESLTETLSSLSLVNCPLTRLSRGQFLIPGLIDTHNHAPQWQQRGLGQGMHILDWLDGITFPNEGLFRDVAHAEKVYPTLVKGMFRQGVTTACYYASLHGEATRVLADLCFKHGQRALIGKCNMNQNSPDFYCEPSTENSLKETEKCIAHIRKIDPSGALVRPVLTPRFAISCTADLLTGIGAIAKRDTSLAIQTHFNEAQQEISATLSLFPDFTNEVDLYEHFNLLTPRSVLAHCTIMTPYETTKLRDLGCGVAHCPTANMTVGGGFMAAPIRDFLNKGIKVGLGTDSGGGFSSSMLDAMRHALIASFAREAVGKDEPGLSLEEVFYMATVGGAQVVGWGDEIGRFDVGKQFDAVVVDMREETGGVNTPLIDSDSTRTIFDKFIMTGDDRNISQVFVKGRKVHGQ